MDEPYAEVFGFKAGDTKSQIYRLPIIYNEHRNAFEISGINGIRPIKITLVWPNRETDLLWAKKIQIAREKEKMKRWNERYVGSRIVGRGRVYYDESVLPFE